MTSTADLGEQSQNDQDRAAQIHQNQNPNKKPTRHKTMTLEEAKQSISDYITNGWQPGSFLTAILSNDLFDAISRADNESRENLPKIVDWIYNNVPSNVYGSRERVRNHIKNHNGI